MKKKFNKDLFEQEIKKFKLLSEYDFYQEKKSEPEFKDLILGDESLAEADDQADDFKPTDDIDNEADKVASDLGVDNEDGGEDAGEETTSDIPDSEELEEPKPEELEEPVQAPEPQSNDVEVDVTSLVKGSEEAKKAADSASFKSDILLKKLSDLEARVASMDKISSKIDGLEKEMIKRNPTPVEKLEMRSLNSYPFSQKLSDYWADKEGPYDVMKNNKDKEYVLTKKDVDSTYSDSNIKKSFTQQSLYEEENINLFDEEDI